MQSKLLPFLLIMYVIKKVENIPHRNFFHYVYFCNKNNEIRATFDQKLGDTYALQLRRGFLALTEIKIQLDSSGIIENFVMNSAINPFKENARVSADTDTINNIFTFTATIDVFGLYFWIRGRSPPNHPPYVISVTINGVEQCREPKRTYFEEYQTSPRKAVKLFEQAPDKLCGRRRINRRYTELVVSGSVTQAGDWPWHAAVLRLQRSTMKYIGGATLISKYVVLTAHAAAINGAPVNPEIITVVLGKYSLVGRDVTVQEKEVFKVILHDEYDHRTKSNDIALLKLTTEAMFNNYVQPACLWFDGIYDHIGHGIQGSVVGWGFDNTDSLSLTLKSASMPEVADSTCAQSNPIFYWNMLNGKRFCAGYRNGTAACNGDSGGGFVVFVQDDLSEDYTGIDYIDGAWYVKGIVSLSLARSDSAICDPNEYTVFTDVAVYKDWILSNIN